MARAALLKLLNKRGEKETRFPHRVENTAKYFIENYSHILHYISCHILHSIIKSRQLQ